MIDDEDENSNLLVNVSVSNDYPDPPLRHEFGGCCLRKRVEFVGTGTLCVVSASALLVLLPLYFGNATHVADIYPAILFCSAISSIVIFSLICLGAKFRVFSSSFLKKNVIPPIPFWKIVQIGSVCGFGGLCVIYALDRQRVLCHLQDPLKGVILVYSMVYYFCFSRKIMVLQKLFCASTIIIGLFVSVDYALCDEFHCRGYEREKVEDDRGHWSQATHVLWGFIYILGLGIWCFHFSMLEGQIVALKLDNPLICSSQTSLLGTISRTVSHQAEDGVYADEHPLSNNEENPLIGSNQPHLLENISCAVACQTDDMVLSSAQPNIVELPLSNDMLESEVNSRRMCVNRESEDQSYMHLNTCVTQRNIRTRLNISANADRPSALCVALWVHTSSFIIVLLFFLATIIPSIGKGLSWTNVKLWSEILTKIQIGLGCHFQSVAAPNDMFVIPTAHPVSCDSLALYGWMFTASLTLFSVSVYHFLILCQSSVFTVALITSALPLANIFWSLFRLHPLNGGSIQWWPSFTAEFVCTLLGIPIIVCGLVFLCKAHWTNMTQKSCVVLFVAIHVLLKLDNLKISVFKFKWLWLKAFVANDLSMLQRCTMYCRRMVLVPTP